MHSKLLSTCDLCGQINEQILEDVAEEEKNRPILLWNVLFTLSALFAHEPPSKIAVLTAGGGGGGGEVMA